MPNIPNPSTAKNGAEAGAGPGASGRSALGRLHTAAIFVARQAWAGLFAIALLAAIAVSSVIWNPGWPLARYDALVIFAVGMQAVLIATRLETWAEARVIAVFHVTGTAMEVFKLARGSWDYPEAGVLEIGGVPLFTGFMYAAIGSYLARAMRLFEVTIAPWPPSWVGAALAGLIYANFFAHHWLPDIRAGLFAATLVLFWPSIVRYRVVTRRRRARLPAIIALLAVAVWVAENVGTLTATWTYPGQGRFDLVALGKLGSWYLLLWLALVTVALVDKRTLRPRLRKPDEREPGELTGPALTRTCPRPRALAKRDRDARLPRNSSKEPR